MFKRDEFITNICHIFTNKSVKLSMNGIILNFRISEVNEILDFSHFDD